MKKIQAKMRYKTEKWKSNQKNEIHYFRVGKREVYLFGYNPKYIGREKMKRIIKIIQE